MVLLLSWLAACGDGKSSSLPTARERLSWVSRFLADRATWDARADDLRRGLSAGMQLDRLPAATPLDPIAHSRRELDGYSVENVAFQSLPGVFVTGNLYRPLGRTGPFPGLLQTHGHFHQKDYFARSLPDNQASAGRLAQMGAVVLAYDMVGYGDFDQLPHDLPFVMALQLWDSLRALDYLSSLPEVDAQRLGAFGPSGGALEVLLLAALDPRVSAAALVIEISAGYDGTDPDEIGMPIRVPTATNNTELSLLLAPRPTLFVSESGDWTRDFPQIDFPYVQRAWALKDAASAVGNVHLAKGAHDFGSSKRAPLYGFFARTFGLEELPLGPDRPNPEGIPPEPQAAQRVFDADHPRPDSLTDPGEVARLLFSGR